MRWGGRWLDLEMTWLSTSQNGGAVYAGRLGVLATYDLYYDTQPVFTNIKFASKDPITIPNPHNPSNPPNFHMNLHFHHSTSPLTTRQTETSTPTSQTAPSPAASLGSDSQSAPPPAPSRSTSAPSTDPPCHTSYSSAPHQSTP